MAPPVLLVVNVIGWKPRPREPRALGPQFDNPVAVRLYTKQGIRRASAWLRLEGDRVIAALQLPAPLEPARLRCFCCTEREHDPASGIERRRITSIDICVGEARW